MLQVRTRLNHNNKQKGLIGGIILLVVFIALGATVALTARTVKKPEPLSSTKSNTGGMNKLYIPDYINPTDIVDVYLSYNRTNSPQLTIAKTERLKGVLTRYLDQKNGHTLEVLDKNNTSLYSLKFAVPNEFVDPAAFIEGKDTAELMKLDTVDFFLKVPAKNNAVKIRLLDEKGNTISEKKLPLLDKNTKDLMGYVHNLPQFLSAYLKVPVIHAQTANQKKCHTDRKDFCININVNKTSVTQGDPIEVTWRVENIGGKGAVALNTPNHAIERFVESSGQKTIIPFWTGNTKLTLTANDGEGHALVYDTEFTVNQKNKATFNIYFVGDKYGLNGMRQFDADVKRFTEHLFTFEPFTSRRNDIRIYAIDNIYTDFEIRRDTNITYWYGHVNLGKVNTFLNSFGIGYNSVAILVNEDEKADRSYITPPIMFVSNSVDYSQQFFIQRLGRQMGLRWEYILKENGNPKTGYETNTPDANCWAGSPPQNPPATWRQHVKEYYPGCENANWYRTSETSIMSSSKASYFNPISQMLLSQRLDHIISQ